MHVPDRERRNINPAGSTLNLNICETRLYSREDLLEYNMSPILDLKVKD